MEGKEEELEFHSFFVRMQYELHLFAYSSGSESCQSLLGKIGGMGCYEQIIANRQEVEAIECRLCYLCHLVDDVEMFSAFDSMNINYYRIDTTKPLAEQKPVDAILHKVM